MRRLWQVYVGMDFSPMEVGGYLSDDFSSITWRCLLASQEANVDTNGEHSLPLVDRASSCCVCVRDLSMHLYYV